MAVTLNVDELQQPTGELSNSFFLQGDMDNLLTGWLLAATAKVEGDSRIASTDHNTAAAAWVYYRAYDYIANQIRANPASAAEGQNAIAVSWQISQSRDWANKAAAKLAEFEALRSTATAIAGIFTLAPGRRGR